MPRSPADDTEALRKARGAFFTPEPVARYVTAWAVRSATDRVLEPSCGEAAFLLAAHERQRQLAARANDDAIGSLDGVELHDVSARSARALLRAAGAEPKIKVGDFFAERPTALYDAVIGNPPYVRYQAFSGEHRIRSRAAALRGGVALTALASSWAAFTVHSALFLKPGGRLGLVLPAELLSVNYAADVRRFLMQRFGRVRLVLFTERVFRGVLEEVVLLLAEGQGPTDHCELVQVRDASELAGVTGPFSTWTPNDIAGKWTSALIPSAAAGTYTELLNDGGFSPLQTWGETTLGMVTGANRYFALSPQRVAELRIPRQELLPLSPPGSRHLRGLSFTSAMRNQLGEGGAATWLFRPPGEPSPGSRAYIADEENRPGGVYHAYKCRVRTPWWRVPLVKTADLLLTYMNADTPRLTTNAAAARHLNSVHGVYLREQYRQIGRQLLPLASLNSATLLGAETVGRAYGGGMLKIEPREADALPVPGPETIAAARSGLTRVRAQVAGQLRAGRLREAVRLVDEIVLVRELGLGRADVAGLAEAHQRLMARRVARGGNP